MLGFMRKKAGSWVIKFVLGAIIIVFIFWGVGSFRQSRKDQVAKVNGTPITQKEYDRAYQRQLDGLKQRIGGALTPEMIKQLQLKRHVLEGLINQKLMLQEAKKLKLRVSDAELSAVIHSIPMFMTAGSFDKRRYLQFVDQLRMTPDEFETAERQVLLLDKLQALLVQGVHVSDGEAKQWYTFANTRIKVDFVLFSPEKYTKIDPTDKELKAYYNAHSAKYTTQPEVKVRYVAIQPAAYVKQVTVPDSDIDQYYDEHPSEFHTEKTVQARHILIRVAPNAPPVVVAAAKKKIEAILKKARGGANFAQLAKKYSEGPSAKQGGELGPFTRDGMVKPFADKAFSMKPGQISDPVRTRFGWHIIKVEKVNKATTQPLDQVKDKIRAKLAQQRAKDMAADVAEKVYDTAFSNADLKKTATMLKLDLKTTGFFDREGTPLQLSGAEKFAAAAFDLQDQDVSSVIECPDAYYVMQRMASKPAVVPPFDAVKTAVRRDVIKEKQKEKAQTDAEAFLKAVKGGADMTSEAARFRLKVRSTGFFSRSDTVSEFGNDRRIVQSAFLLSAQKRFPDKVLESPMGDFVIAFKDRKVPDPKGFAAVKDTIVKSVRQQKEREYYAKWIDKLRARSDISISDAYQNLD